MTEVQCQVKSRECSINKIIGIIGITYLDRPALNTPDWLQRVLPSVRPSRWPRVYGWLGTSGEGTPRGSSFLRPVGCIQVTRRQDGAPIDNQCRDRLVPGQRLDHGDHRALDAGVDRSGPARHCEAEAPFHPFSHSCTSLPPRATDRHQPLTPDGPPASREAAAIFPATVAGAMAAISLRPSSRGSPTTYL